jgi:C_GCAxxG_C_C family probable redox protein
MPIDRGLTEVYHFTVPGLRRRISDMNNTGQGHAWCNRRRWIGIAAGAGALTAIPAWALQDETKGTRWTQPDLARELSPEEHVSAKSSRLVVHALQLKREGGYNCAELVLTAVLKSYNLPQKTSEAAAAFGGGIGHGEVCGFLTGASMALGVLAFKSGGERAEVKQRLKGWNDALWMWWKNLAPLACRDLRPHYNKAGFENMLIRVCLQVEKIVAVSSVPANR